MSYVRLSEEGSQVVCPIGMWPRSFRVVNVVSRIPLSESRLSPLYSTRRRGCGYATMHTYRSALFACPSHEAALMLHRVLWGSARNTEAWNWWCSSAKCGVTLPWMLLTVLSAALKQRGSDWNATVCFKTALKTDSSVPGSAMPHSSEARCVTTATR